MSRKLLNVTILLNAQTFPSMLMNAVGSGVEPTATIPRHPRDRNDAKRVNLRNLVNGKS